MNEKILVADDEPQLLSMICEYLIKLNYTVVKAQDGAEALALFKKEKPDLAVLDVMMPQVNGFDVAKEILKTSQTPFIFLSARGEEMDKVLGLELGGDDYITKPFSPRELAARIKAVLRRSSVAVHKIDSFVHYQDLRISEATRSVEQKGLVLKLSALQFDILLFFVKNPGRVFSRLQILEATQEVSFPGYERTVDAHIKNLRKALKDDALKPKYIETVRSVGYRFIEQDAFEADS